MEKRSYENRDQRCYEIAMHIVSDNPSARLIHGTINGKGGRIYHAWNEIDGNIYDPVLDKLYSPSEYHERFNPKVIKEYASQEAIWENLRSNHYGPYHDTLDLK